MAEGSDSLRDYFIRFLFKTDKVGAETVQRLVKSIEERLKNAGHRAQEFNEKWEKFKTTIVEPIRRFREMIDHTAEEADNLRDLSERTGIATQTLEEYGYMAKLAGTSQETLTTGLRILEKNMGEAAQGGKEQAETFAKLGISLHGANGKMKTQAELLPEVSKAFEKLPDHATKTAMAMKLFGRSGQELLPLLEKGADEIAHMQRELALLGGVTSEEFLDASEKYVDNIEKMGQVWKGIRQAIAGPFIRMFNQSNDKLLQWWKVWGEMVRSRITEWVNQLVVSWQAFLKTIMSIARPLLLLAAAMNVPLLVMIGLKALLVLLIDDFANWMAGNDSLIGRMIENWQEWLTELAKTHPTLAAMMGAFGDFVSAASQGVEALFRLFDTLITAFLEGGWDGFIKELGTTWDTAVDTWKVGFEEFADWLGNQLDGIAEMFKLPFVMLGEWIDNIFGGIKDKVFDVLMGAKNLAKSLGLDSVAESIGSATGSFMRGERVNGPGGSPSAVAGAVSNSTANNVSAPVNIQVEASPGMDTRDLANKIGEVFDQRMASVVRQSFNAVVPEAY